MFELVQTSGVSDVTSSIQLSHQQTWQSATSDLDGAQHLSSNEPTARCPPEILSRQQFVSNMLQKRGAGCSTEFSCKFNAPHLQHSSKTCILKLFRDFKMPPGVSECPEIDWRPVQCVHSLHPVCPGALEGAQNKTDGWCYSQS